MKIDEGRGYWVEGNCMWITPVRIYTYELHDTDSEMASMNKGDYVCSVFRIVILVDSAFIVEDSEVGDTEEEMDIEDATDQLRFVEGSDSAVKEIYEKFVQYKVKEIWGY